MRFKCQYREKFQIMTFKKIRTLRDDLFSSLFKTYRKWKITISYGIQA